MYDKGKTWALDMLYNNALLALISIARLGTHPPKKMLMSGHPPYPKKSSLIPISQHGHMEELRFLIQGLLGSHTQIVAQSIT